MRKLKAILMTPLRIIIFLIQFALTVSVVIFGAAGGIVTKAGEIVGGLLILGSFLCVATGQISGDIFLKMFEQFQQRLQSLVRKEYLLSKMC